jgi:hypothetical protein
MVGKDEIGIHGGFVHETGKTDHKRNFVEGRLDVLGPRQRIARIGFRDEQRLNPVGCIRQVVQQIACVGVFRTEPAPSTRGVWRPLAATSSVTTSAQSI